MAMLKGFINIANYVSNVPNVVAPLGEISTWSMTYSRERGEYVDTEVPGYKLISFRHVNTDNEEIEVSRPLSSHVLEVARDIVAYATNNLRPFDKQDYVNSLLVTHHLKATEFQLGDIVEGVGIGLPEWASWMDQSTQPATYTKVWFSDEAFREQYDEYHITVIPPIEPIDGLFSHFNLVSEKLGEVTMQEFGIRIQDAKVCHPETYIRMADFDLINRLNPSQTLVTTWGVLVYGKQGDYVDAIKDAIVDFVMDNTERDRDEWEVILPDIFKRTEFIVLPRWDKTAIEDMTRTAGLYGNFINPLETIAFCKEHIDFYQNSHIEANINIIPFDYRTLMLAIVNGSNNIVGAERLDEMFSDYIPVPSTNPDFGRMREHTREWVLFLDRLLQSAEVATEYMSVGKGIRRRVRGGVLFVTAMYENVNYMVAAKSNVFYNE